MATIKSNALLKELSGMLGRTLVFRQRGDKVVVAMAPAKRKQISEKQLVQQQRFIQAQDYARRCLADPDLKEAYAEMAREHKLPNACNAAIADFFHGPKITSLQQQGQLVWCMATDNFRVNKVEIEVYSKDGHLLEKGTADSAKHPNLWTYVMKETYPSTGRIVAVATDLPGNQTEQSITCDT